MPYDSDDLAIGQSFSKIDIETYARERLNHAAKAYWKDDLTESANLFLESWRILQNEYESNLYKRFDSLPKHERYQEEQDVVRKNKRRMLLSFVALHDLARACSRNHEEYKDEDGSWKLRVNAPLYSWSRYTTAEELEIEENNESRPLPEGSAIALVLKFKDPMGRLLEEADSFREAAHIIAGIGSLQIACASKLSEESSRFNFSNPEDAKLSEDYFSGCKFIEHSLLFMRLRTHVELAAIKAGERYRFDRIQEEKKNDSEDEDEKFRKKLVVKLKELEKKNDPLNEKEEEDLAALFEQCQITPSLWKGPEHPKPHKGLEQFHIMTYEGENFEQIREENNNSEQEEDEGEKGELAIEWKEEEEMREKEEMQMKEKEEEMKLEEKIKRKEKEMKLKEEKELVELFKRLHVKTHKTD